MESLCSRKRPCGGAALQLHQEAHCQPPACKRRCREEEQEEMKTRRRRCREEEQEEMKTRRRRCREEEQEETKTRRRRRRCSEEEQEKMKRRCREEEQEEMKTRRRRCREEEQEEMKTRRRGAGSEENKDPGEDLLNLKRQTRSGSGFSCGGEVQLCRPEVRLALIRKTRVQTHSGSAETQMDHSRPSWVRQTGTTESTSEVRSRSTAGPLRVEVLPSDQSSETRTRRRRVLGPESCRAKEVPPKTRTGSEARTRTGTEAKTRTGSEARTRRRVPPSALRGQLRLSITPGAGQLIIHIREARGLRSCDSYVKVVTSDLSIRMKTPTVLSNKNPEYNQEFILCVSDDVILSRLMVSVFSRCSRLIGCMSFGIRSLVSSSEAVTGWFYLLGAELGQSKHLRVKSQQNKPTRTSEADPPLRPVATCDLRRTPDSAPDSDLNRISAAPTNLNCISAAAAAAANLNHGSGAGGLRDVTNSRTSSLDPGSSTLLANTNQQQATRDSSSPLTVNVVRGADGFGFTICCDCPVRVQAVDPGGPAHQSGLRQGDSVLQLNGLPVETWKCVDLAHAIRSCSSQISLVVWRGLPELRSGGEAWLCPPPQAQATGRKLLPHPAHSKHGRRRAQGVRSSLGALGSLWRDRKEEREEALTEELAEFSPRTATLKGTRVTSSQGDNYIILSPVDPGGQMLPPVYQDRGGTMGRLYQTHPSRGHSFLQDTRPGSTRRPFTSTLPPPAAATPAPPTNYGNYQNCTIVQSHLPCSAYGTYVSLTPKTLIFPIFVQPLDLCSPDRTLLMSEEMVLHQADLLPAKVTVLIYSDLLLFTREDEAGRCNVLQSPLYLNTLQPREVASAPLQIYFLQSAASTWRCLFSLEAFSLEQKVRVSLCLHDNIQLQLGATETGHTHQLSDLPSDFGLLSLGQSDLLFRASPPFSSSEPPLHHPSSPYSPLSSTPPPFSLLSSCTSSAAPSWTFPSPLHPLHPLPLPPPSSTHRSPVWKERGGAEEEEEERRRRRREEVEERQQGEGESSSETSESVGGVWGRSLLLSPLHFNTKEEESEEEEEGGGAEELTYRPAVLRRSLSEGSLLHEPRSPRFLSDSTIHRLIGPTGPAPSGPAPRRPSAHTLRKQLTREGGSLHHMLLLLNGTKDSEFRNLQLKKKTKSLAADVRSHLLFLRRRNNSTFVHGNSLEKALRNNRPSVQQVLRWAESLEALLTNQYGLAVFRHFLRSEFSEENLDFWLAVERFKRTRPLTKLAARAAKIYDEFISTNAARQVNVDSSVRESTNQGLRLGVHPESFQRAQDQVFGLMETDSYPRFLKSRLFAQLANQGSQTVGEPSNRSAAGGVPAGQS